MSKQRIASLPQQLIDIKFHLGAGLVILISISTSASLSLAAAPPAPYPASPVIKGLELDWSTHQRFAPGSDNFQLTWADDGHLYGAWGDGGGFGGTNGKGRVGLGIARIEGSPNQIQGFNVWGGFQPENPATFDGKSWGMLSLNKTLYMWLVPDKPKGKNYRNHYEYIELAASQDHGANWIKAPWRFTQKERISIPTFLNFGKDYADIPNSWAHYVYSYFIEPQNITMEHQGPRGVGLIVHKPGRIYLARVPANQLLKGKSSYQFFTGIDSEGHPEWGELQEKRPVFEDPNGVGWCMSACYHPTLKRILLCTEHHQSSRSILGLFDAPTPWGPWTTVEYFNDRDSFGAQRPGSDLPWRPNVFFAAFPSKWLKGVHFTMNFTGAGAGKDNDSFNTVDGKFLE